MKIGPYTLVSPVYVAPMAGVTDAPFRKIAREFGAGLACTEMISSEALVRQHRESFRLMDLGWDELFEGAFQHGDLSDKSAADVRIFFLGHEEDGLDLRVESEICQRHGEFVFHVAESA